VAGVRPKLGTSFRVANVDENGLTVSGDLLKGFRPLAKRRQGVDIVPAAQSCVPAFTRSDLEMKSISPDRGRVRREHESLADAPQWGRALRGNGP